MSDKRIFILAHPEARRRAMQALAEAPEGHSVTIQPPKIGAIAGAIEKIIVTSDSSRAAAASEYRSRMMARPGDISRRHW